MIVAIVDIGSNTARLLVASVGGEGEIIQLRRERHYLRLGNDVHALGLIGPGKLKEAGQVAKRFARIAWKSGAEQIETVVTAPGRQASNGDELVSVLSEETQAPVIVLSGEDEGRLAWEGAVARMDDPPEIVPWSISGADRASSPSGRRCSGRHGCGPWTPVRYA